MITWKIIRRDWYGPPDGINDVPPSSGGQFNQIRTAMLEVLHFGKAIQSDIELTKLNLISSVDASKVESSVRVFKTVTEDVYISFNW